jgi:pimeloyl-ACP methyl ester carboxylesterase
MQTWRFKSFDGVELAIHTLGQGPPVILLHGFLSSAQANWFAPSIAQAIASAGFQVVAPDLRGHGQSDAPTDPAAWPADVMASDQLALLRFLEFPAYDLVGYSLGARTAVRAMVRGLAPRRAVLGGMGDTGLTEAGGRAALFEDAIRNGLGAEDKRSGRVVARMMADEGLKREAMLGALASFQSATEAEISAIEAPSLVVCGDDDHDNGSPHRLANLLPNGVLATIPGDHISAVSTPEFREAVVRFLI